MGWLDGFLSTDTDEREEQLQAMDDREENWQRAKHGIEALTGHSRDEDGHERLRKQTESLTSFFGAMLEDRQDRQKHTDDAMFGGGSTEVPKTSLFGGSDGGSSGFDGGGSYDGGTAGFKP